jgi:hypothetical protein
MQELATGQEIVWGIWAFVTPGGAVSLDLSHSTRGCQKSTRKVYLFRKHIHTTYTRQSDETGPGRTHVPGFRRVDNLSASRDARATRAQRRGVGLGVEADLADHVAQAAPT